METAALWTAVEKQPTTRSLQRSLRFSTASHSAWKTARVARSFPTVPTAPAATDIQKLKNPGRKCPLLEIQQSDLGRGSGYGSQRGLQQGFAGSFFQKKELFQTRCSLTQNGHLLHYEMPASLRSDKVAILPRTRWPFWPEYATIRHRLLSGGGEMMWRTPDLTCDGQPLGSGIFGGF